MQINYDNIPDMMTDEPFWDLIRKILFDDAGRIAQGILSGLKSSQPRNDEKNLKIRLRAALWLILINAVTGIRPKTLAKPFLMPIVADYNELSEFYDKQFSYLLRLLDRGIGLDEIQRRWGIDIKELPDGTYSHRI